MPDLTGIEFSKTLQNSSKIIFTTAYEHYALEGFKLSAVDYLLKPFNYPEFLTAVQKAKKLIELEQAALPTLEANNQFLFLKSEYKISRKLPAFSKVISRLMDGPSSIRTKHEKW